MKLGKALEVDGLKLPVHQRGRRYVLLHHGRWLDRAADTGGVEQGLCGRDGIEVDRVASGHVVQSVIGVRQNVESDLFDGPCGRNVGADEPRHDHGEREHDELGNA